MDKLAWMLNRQGALIPSRTILATTRWSLVKRACAEAGALEEWVGTCWYPLYAWARYRKWSPEDAADAVQEFLSRICVRNQLAQVDPSRGRFRSWLLTGFANHLSTTVTMAGRQKRGGGQSHQSLDLEGIEEIYHQDMHRVADAGEAYTRAWAITLMDEALLRLEAYYQGRCHGDLFKALLPALEGPLTDGTYEEAAAGLGMTGAALRQAALRFRQRYRSLLLEVAGERLGITCEARLREELRELLGA